MDRGYRCNRVDGVASLLETRPCAPAKSSRIIVDMQRTGYTSSTIGQSRTSACSTRRYDDRGRRRDVRQHSRRPRMSDPNAGGAKAGRGGAKPGTGTAVHASIDREIETTDGAPQPPHFEVAARRQSNDCRRGFRQALDLMAPILGADRATNSSWRSTIRRFGPVSGLRRLLQV